LTIEVKKEIYHNGVSNIEWWGVSYGLFVDYWRVDSSRNF
jgi:DNA-binding transcriptional regulator WhiA